MFPNKEYSEIRRCYITSAFQLILEYTIRKGKANHMLKFNGTHQVIRYADDVNLQSNHTP